MKNAPSLRLRLAASLTAATLAVALISGITAWLAIHDEANDYQDDILRQTATLIDPHNPPRRADLDDDNRIDIEASPVLVAMAASSAKTRTTATTTCAAMTAPTAPTSTPTPAANASPSSRTPKAATPSPAPAPGTPSRRCCCSSPSLR